MIRSSDITTKESSSIYPYPFSDRAFCFGCDEGRHGKVINRKRAFANVIPDPDPDPNSYPYLKSYPRFYDEVICEGCDTVMRLFRLYIPEVIQTYSHEGFVVWIIETRIYLAWKEWFDSIGLLGIQFGNIAQDGNLISKNNIDKNVVSLQFTDDGDQPEDLMRLLLKIGATLPKPKTIKTEYFGHSLTVDFGAVDWKSKE